MPIIDDIARHLQLQIDTLWYNVLLSLAALQWSALRAAILAGYAIELLNNWLVERAFTPLIAQTAASLEVAVSLAFVIALLVLGITYLLAAFIRLDVVAPRRAILWYVAALLFFALGPQLYAGMNDLRREIANGFYLSALYKLCGIDHPN